MRIKNNNTLTRNLKDIELNKYIYNIETLENIGNLLLNILCKYILKEFFMTRKNVIRNGNESLSGL